MNLIIRNLDFSQYNIISAEDHCGGIWCLWNPINIDMTIMPKENRAIHCHIMDNANNKQCILIAIYALAQERDKNDFWHHLKQLNDSIKLQ